METYTQKVGFAKPYTGYAILEAMRASYPHWSYYGSSLTLDVLPNGGIELGVNDPVDGRFWFGGSDAERFIMPNATYSMIFMIAAVELPAFMMSSASVDTAKNHLQVAEKVVLRSLEMFNPEYVPKEPTVVKATLEAEAAAITYLSLLGKPNRLPAPTRLLKLGAFILSSAPLKILRAEEYEGLTLCEREARGRFLSLVEGRDLYPCDEGALKQQILRDLEEGHLAEAESTLGTESYKKVMAWLKEPSGK